MRAAEHVRVGVVEEVGAAAVFVREREAEDVEPGDAHERAGRGEAPARRASYLAAQRPAEDGEVAPDLRVVEQVRGGDGHRCLCVVRAEAAELMIEVLHELGVAGAVEGGAHSVDMLSSALQGRADFNVKLTWDFVGAQQRGLDTGEVDAFRTQETKQHKAAAYGRTEARVIGAPRPSEASSRLREATRRRSFVALARMGGDRRPRTTR